MLTFLFWNLNRADLTELLVDAVNEFGVDVLMLGESVLKPVAFLRKVNKGRAAKFGYHPNAADSGSERRKIDLFTILPSADVAWRRDAPGIAACEINHPTLAGSVLLAMVHLRSKIRITTTGQEHLCLRAAKEVVLGERDVGHHRTIVVGDFNMNPFESAIVSSEGFHAIISSPIAKSGSRIVQAEERRFFYNPSWKLFRPPMTGRAGGTYFFRDNEPLTYFWNTFDQVLVRPELIEGFDMESFDLVERIGDRKLTTPAGIPDAASASDHLPLMFRLKPI